MGPDIPDIAAIVAGRLAAGELIPTVAAAVGLGGAAELDGCIFDGESKQSFSKSQRHETEQTLLR